MVHRGAAFGYQLHVRIEVFRNAVDQLKRFKKRGFSSLVALNTKQKSTRSGAKVFVFKFVYFHSRHRELFMLRMCSSLSF